MSPMMCTSVSAGLPAVMVPVLSMTIVSSSWAVSRAAAERIRMPACAPLPVPTMMDRGGAGPGAQGHAMISRETADTGARVTAGDGPTMNQVANAAMAMAMTAGTK